LILLVLIPFFVVDLPSNLATGTGHRVNVGIRLPGTNRGKQFRKVIRLELLRRETMTSAAVKSPETVPLGGHAALAGKPAGTVPQKKTVTPPLMFG
jgi:hypothetical protein